MQYLLYYQTEFLKKERIAIPDRTDHRRAATLPVSLYAVPTVFQYSFLVCR
jgi:hypothetical protein